MREEDKNDKEEDSGGDKQFYWKRQWGYCDAMNTEIMQKRDKRDPNRRPLSMTPDSDRHKDYRIFTVHHHQSKRFILREDKEMTAGVSAEAAMLLRALTSAISWPSPAQPPQTKGGHSLNLSF